MYREVIKQKLNTILKETSGTQISFLITTISMNQRILMVDYIK